MEQLHSREVLEPRAGNELTSAELML